MKTKIVMRVTPESEIAYWQLKLKDLPARKPFVFVVDRPRDRYKADSRISDAGVAPPRRKRGRPAGSQNRQRSVTELEAKIPFTCKHCGKSGMAKTKDRYFCYNKGLCKGRHATAEKKRRDAK